MFNKISKLNNQIKWLENNPYENLICIDFFKNYINLFNIIKYLLNKQIIKTNIYILIT